MTELSAQPQPRRRPRPLLVGLALLALAVVVVSAAFASGLLTGSSNSGQKAQATTQAPTPSQSGSPSADPSPSAIPSEPDSLSSSALATPTEAASATPTASPTPPPLPAMLAAIGDSYSQAYDVSPTLPKRHDNVAYSWVLGTAKGDRIYSIRERFEALGASLTVVDAATSGKKMDDAVRQANLVVAEAQKLPPGATVYVTFELGTNDLCDDPKTDPTLFLAQLRAAAAVLEDGLPPGSRILMLSVPDFNHFRAITQANPTIKAYFEQPKYSRRCAPFLGTDTPTSLSEASAILGSYTKSLVRVCDEIEATYGPSGRLHCTSNRLGLAQRDFKLADLSGVDYFHPSFSGQARLAAAAWKLGDWGMVPLPAGAAQ